MNIFITGGTGVLGRRLVPRLIEQGHQVGVAVRSMEKAHLVTNMGALPHLIDLFDPEQVSKAIAGYETVIHLATSIPSTPKTKPKDWELNNRLRTEVTGILLEKSKENNVKLYIQESYVGIYGHRGQKLVVESGEITNPVETAINIGPEFHNVFASLVQMEEMVQNANLEGLPTIILRFGIFYSHDSSMIPDMARGKFPIIGSGDNYMSILSVDDAVRSIISAFTNSTGNTGKVFNITENDVPTMKELLNFSSQYIGKNKASKVPKFLVKLLFGRFAVNFMTTSTRMSNQLASEKLGWRPKFNSYRDGIMYEIDLFNKI